MLMLIVASNTDVVTSQQQQQRQQPALQPLGDVLHLVLDKDKNQRVTMAEVDDQLSMLGLLFQNADGDKEAEEYRRLLDGAKLAAPKLFELLDSDGDGSLTKIELQYVTRFEKSLPSKKEGGGMRDLLRDVFGMLDVDSDDRLSAEELSSGFASDDVVARATARFHELLPLRETPGELENFVRETIVGSYIGGMDNKKEESVAALAAAAADGIVRWMDDDGDGFIQRREVGRHYNVAGRKFAEISKTIKQMGPMMALFGGMGDMNGGGGGGGGGFKMDL